MGPFWFLAELSWVVFLCCGLSDDGLGIVPGSANECVGCWSVGKTCWLIDWWSIVKQVALCVECWLIEPLGVIW